AERADDVVQQARILTNQADCRLREARYPQALEVAVRAVRAAELGGPPGLLMTALHNAGEALTRLGRYDEAALHFERSIRIGHRVGLNRIAAGLYGLAEVDRRLGRREQSRSRFEEAADLARATAEVQILVPALSRLARLLLDGSAADPAAARAAADEAERIAPPALASRALVAGGWVALADGDLALAQRRAADATQAARAGRQADALAESLELAAAVSADAGAARAALQEAAAIWERAGALPAADQMRVLLGRLPGADSGQRLAARSATRRLLGLGVRTVNGSPLLPAEGNAATVQVRVLGRFEVFVAGRPVPLPAWRSRQARTLLKILAARRGRPVPRSELCELLWPDDEPQRTAHRLSVLLSVVRTVLDPLRLWAPDHYLAADLTGVSLDVSRVTVDVEDLLRDATHGMQLAREGDAALAREILAEVDAAYRGDAFDDEPYEGWADGLREQARSVWLRALRELADLWRSAQNPEQAITCLVRLL
ncbi:tetratricopeptide repeat protein, partial [Actinoplanes sp. NPDC051633]|uniref:tetratricopeptide repeat protein n=1 Tax=Actinoplanes sp. NPDC051633 TaxID=3155670 RepID=UPI00342D64F3